MKREFKIYISKEMILQMSGLELATYCCSNLLTSSQIYEGVNFIPISVNSLTRFIYGKSVSREQIKEIDSILNKLMSDNQIYFERTQDSYFYFDRNSFFKQLDKFTTISFSEVEKIIHSNNRCRFDVLKYYILLLMSRKYFPSYKRAVVGELSFVALGKLSGNCTKTIQRYNSILEELGVIYIHRVRINPVKKKNYYGRKCDEELIRQYVSLQDSSDML